MGLLHNVARVIGKSTCANISLLVSCTVNCLLSPEGAYCFEAHWGEGGLMRGGGGL